VPRAKTVKRTQTAIIGGSDACVHHWVIDGRNHGVCKKCGAGQQFSGWTDYNMNTVGFKASAEDSAL